MLANGFVTTFVAAFCEKDTSMKSPRIPTIVSALLLVFGMPAPGARADDKPAAAHVPFRFLFNAYDGDPKNDGPAKMEFQINTIDLRQPSEFLKLGERITNTKWKLAKFEFKSRTNAQTGEPEDFSELTLVNTETKQEVVLTLNRVTDMAAPAPKK